MLNLCCDFESQNMNLILCLLFFFSPFVISAQTGSTRVEFETVKQDVIQQRLEMVQRKVSDRQRVLEDLFRQVGCADLTEQRVPGSKGPNIICAHNGAESEVITVGAHYDAAGVGTGAVDDWSGASLLPSLYQSIETTARRHRFIFVGFSAEEKGLVGSKTYVKRLSDDDRVTIRAMVNLECLGVSLPKVWAHRADKGLLESYLRVAKALQVPAAEVNVEKIGDDDSHPFLNAKIPVITIHSLTQETWPILHSKRDQLQAINPEDYYATYRLLATYLSYLDSSLP